MMVIRRHGLIIIIMFQSMSGTYPQGMGGQPKAERMEEGKTGKDHAEKRDEVMDLNNIISNIIMITTSITITIFEFSPGLDFFANAPSI